MRYVERCIIERLGRPDVADLIAPAKPDLKPLRREAAAIRANLDEAAGTSALTPFASGQQARQVWDGLDQSRRRAVIDALCTVPLHPAGRGARNFDEGTVVLSPKH